MYHVAGIHEWPGFELFSESAHEALTEKHRQTKVRLPIGFPVHNAVKEVAWKPKVLKDVLLLVDFIQTGGLEVFHGTMAKKYLPKAQHYLYNGMKCWTQLAVIDKTTLKEELPPQSLVKPILTVISQAQKKWVEKPIYEEISYQFVEELMRDAVLLKQGEINVAPLQGPVLPANIAPTPCGNKQEIIDQFTSSFH